MTDIVLIRHAATAWSGGPLPRAGGSAADAEGRDAATAMAARVAATIPTGVRIVTSPSLRARETAEIVAEAFDRRSRPVLEPDPRWAEVDVGDAEGLTFDGGGGAISDARAPARGRRDRDRLAGGRDCSRLPCPDRGSLGRGRRRRTADDRRLACGSDPSRDRARDGTSGIEIEFPAPAEVIHLEIDD